MKKDLYILDSFALYFRSHFAFMQNPLKTSAQEPTSALFGYANTIFRLLLERKVEYFGIATDPGGTNWRHDLYPAYKANREEMPAEMQAQMPAYFDFLKITGLPVLRVDGYEADDLMAVIAKRAPEWDFFTYLVTKDKDMMQIVSDKTALFHLEKAGVAPTITGIEEVIAKFGVPPEQIRDMLALMGDAADNVPGVPKIGPKTAQGLLERFGTLEGIYNNLDYISQKAVKANLIEFKEQAFLSQQLVTLHDHLPLDLTPQTFEFKGFDHSLIKDWLERWELFSLLKHLKKFPNIALAPEGYTSQIEEDSSNLTLSPAWQEPQYVLVDNLEKLKNLASHLQDCKSISIDTETTGLDVLTAELVGICLSGDGQSGYYLPLLHQLSHNLSLEEIHSVLGPILNDPKKEWVCHNSKYDKGILKRASLCPVGRIDDTMLASYVINPGVKEHSLDFQVQLRLEHTMIPLESLLGKLKAGNFERTFDTLSAEEAYTYGAEDALFTFRLWTILKKELESENLWTAYNEVELPLVDVLLDMENRGICIDLEQLKTLSLELETRKQELLVQIYELAGEEFNVSSPKQLSVILFEKLGLKGGKKTKTGWSTNAAVLDDLAGEHPIIDCILEYREVEKLRNTYVEALPTMVHPKTKRIHTHFNQIVAATGRLSSQNPNLQNIPVRTALGKRVRSAFIPEAGKVLFSADYSQIELRVLAHMSDDAHLKQAYIEGEDIHTKTAAAIYDVIPEFVDSEMRRSAKAINFGVLYGMSAFRLSNELKIPRARAQSFIDNYFAAYPGVVAFMENTVQEAHRRGFVTTLFGHRRILDDLAADNANVRSGAERMALNTPIQGTAAGLIKKAMIALRPILKESGLNAHMLLQVHDELVFEVDEADAPALKTLVQEVMSQTSILSIPLEISVGWGESWVDAH